MIHLKRISWIIVVLCSLHGPQVAHASFDIAPTTQVRGTALTVDDALDVFAAHGCLPTLLKGDRLRTAAEIKRLIEEAGPCRDRYPAGYWLHDLWHKMDQQFGSFRAYRSTPWNTFGFMAPRIYGEYLFYQDDRRAIRPTVSIDAFTSPWTANREGFPFAPEQNGLIGAESGIAVGRWLNLQAEPTFLSTSADASQVSFHSAALKLSVSNFEFKIGRSELYWGQGQRYGTVLMSHNASPMDMAQISSPLPTLLPWILKYLGPFRYEVFLANLDKEQHFPNPYLLGGRIMFKPWPNFEFGISRTVTFGGEGARSIFPLEPLGELFGIRARDGWFLMIPVGSNAHSGPSNSNNNFGLDIRWRARYLRNTEFFLELYNEDPFDPLDFFPDDSVIHWGVWVPRLTADGTWQLLFEGAYAANIVYRHSTFLSGFVNGHRVMGIDAGPRSLQFHLRADRIFYPKGKVWAAAGAQLFPARDGAPSDEYRALFEAGTAIELVKGLRLEGAAGIQFIQNFDFKPGSRVAPMARVGLGFQL